MYVIEFITGPSVGDRHMTRKIVPIRAKPKTRDRPDYESNPDMLADLYTKRIYLRNAIEKLQDAESWLHRFCDATSINEDLDIDVLFIVTSLRCIQDDIERKRSMLKEVE